MAQMSRFTRISSEEFERFITGLVPEARLADVSGTREEVWDLPLPADDLTIRVFSTIEGGTSRGHGEDAIRCVVWNHAVNEPIGGRRKTLRLGPSKSNPEGWRRKLREKVQDLYLNWRDHAHGSCPRCGTGALVERTPSGSQDWDAFLACSEWNGGDGCDFTRSL